MTYDPNDPIRNPNDPIRNPSTEPDLRTPPRRGSSTWIGWVAAIALILVAAFAITEWFGRPGTDPNPTASTTESQPMKPPVVPAAPSSEPATPAPATPSTGGTTQQ
ncbi:hypothetical protein K9B32_20000 [Rhizobium sp. 3T7]|uniref:hypothetical protein n=1 Tax=Rhizobium sp. 3T7 TaxID=2874922 RepID=UPI001CCEE537|nr:hypothetical protein [Rhizobium sp. 3T7]MBZ9792372.1 hypothetical protein [Rhizobium sp. 3T7]